MNSDATLIAAPIPGPKPPLLRTIFIGQDGLRAGWSLLIFFAICAAISFPISFLARRFHAPKLAMGTEISPLSGITVEGLNFCVILFAAWVMSKIERRPAGAYGFGDGRRFAHFLAGLGWGVTCLSLLVLTLWKTGLLVIDKRLLFGGDVLRYGALWFVGFLFVGLFEEYVTRGYVQYTLTRGLAGIYRSLFKMRNAEALSFWTSAVIFSFLFGLGHSSNPGESPIGEWAAGLVGLVFCLSLWRTGSLWWAVGFHAAWDWAQSFLYGVPDSGLMVQHHLFATHPLGKPLLSGGTTGPEGSVYVLAILAVATLIIVLTLRQIPRRDSPVASITPA